MKKLALFLGILLATQARSDTPAPGTIKIKGGTDGTSIGNISDALKVTITGGGGSSTVDQGTGGVSPWTFALPSLASTSTLQSAGNTTLSSILSTLQSPIAVTGTFWQATQPVSGPLTDAQLRASAVPVSGTFFQATQPVSAASLPLPSGAATALLQNTINTTLGSPFQAGGSIGNTAFGISGTLPAFASTPTFNLGTLNGAATSALQGTSNTYLSSIDTKLTAPLSVTASSLPLPSGASTSANQSTANSSLSSIDGKLNSLGQKTMANSSPVVLASDQSSIPVASTTVINANGSISNNAAITTTASTFTAPANAVGFILEAESGNTANIRWAVGSTATASVGSLAEPGRDTGYIPMGANISVIAISGTQSASVQWVLR